MNHRAPLPKRYRVMTTKEITSPPSISAFALTDLEWDQLSALLTDYLAFSHTQALMLEDCKALQALELLNTWRTQAADLRDRIEARD